MWVADGFIRYKSFETAGKDTIPVDLRQGTYRDALLFACGANAAHGQRRTRGDKRKAILTLLHDTEWSKRSNSWIAEACGVDDHTVATVRAEIQPDHAQPRNPAVEGDQESGEPDRNQDTTIGKDGKRRRKPNRDWFTMCARCSRIGKPTCTKCLGRALEQKPYARGEAPQKPGSELVDWKGYENHFGYVVRVLDAMEKHYPECKPEANGLRKMLSEYKKAFDETRKKALKAN